MIDDRQILNIADLLTDDPDIFEAKKPKKTKKVKEEDFDDDFEDKGPGLEHQKEPRDPGKQTHKTTLKDVGDKHPGSKGSKK